MSEDPPRSTADPPRGTESTRGTGKKPYSAPVLMEWGSLQELTQAAGNHGNRDGGRRPFNKTR
ncbi:lasso RiPP family leader peptide-containing protein [Reyranella sp.]|jgi:hypothetical protein|uniref:lasso RiPP family leader peptide-containing protein n=1 Tax=Reyranella sp. TaxID=1929291 RepID=UPI002F9306A2